MVSRVNTTSRTQLSYAVEATVGQVPAVKGARLRFTGESLSQEIEKSQSNEIDPSRQTRSMFLSNANVAGNIEAELSAQEFDAFFEAALLGTWSAYGTAGASTAAALTIDPAAKTIKFTAAPAGNDALNKLVPGQFIVLSGAAVNDKNLVPVRVVTATTDTITYEGATLIAQAGITASISTGRITNGVAEKSFTLEKLFAEKGIYYIYKGMRLNQFTLSVTAREAVTISFEFIGTEAEKKTVASFTTPYTESFSHPIIDAVLGVKNILINGQSIRDLGSAGIKSFELTFSNNMEGQEGVGVLGNVDVMLGDIAATISMEIYADDGSFFESALNQDRYNIAFAAYDTNGKGYAFTLPSVEFSANQPQAGGKNQALTVTLEGTALMDPETKQSIFIDRF